MMMTALAALGYARSRAKPLTSLSEPRKLFHVILGCFFSMMVGATKSPSRNWYKTDFGKDALGKPIVDGDLAPDLIKGIRECYTQLGQGDFQSNTWLKLPNYDSTGYYQMRGETPPIWKVFFDQDETFTAYVLPPQCADYYKVEFLTFQEIDAKRKEALNAYWKKYGNAASAKSPQNKQHVSSGRHNLAAPTNYSPQYAAPPQQIYEAPAHRPSSRVVWKVVFRNHPERAFIGSALVEEEYKKFKTRRGSKDDIVWIDNVANVKGKLVGYGFKFYSPASQIGYDKYGNINTKRPLKRYVNGREDWTTGLWSH